MSEHSEILPLLAAHHDGALTADDTARVLHHLEACDACRQRLSDWQALDRALREVPDDAPAERDLRLGSLMAAIPTDDARSERIDRREPGRKVLVWTVAAAAAVTIVLSGSLLLNQADEPARIAATSGPEASPPGGAAPEPEATIPGGESDRRPGGQDTSDSPGADASGAARQSDAAAEPLTADRSGTTSGRTGPEQQGEVPPSTRLASHDPTAPVSVADGDSGIPHYDDWPARLYDSIAIPIHYRLPEAFAADVVEMNLVPEFEVAFVGVGYAVGDLLAPDHEIRLDQPIELSSETSYLVSNLRTERAVLMSRVGQQVVSAEISLRLAEITWRLANITADPDDVYSAIAAQTLAMRQKPELVIQSRARVAHLQGLIR